MKILAAACLLVLLPAVAFAQVKAEDKTCQTDDDCQLIPIACNSCCPMYDMQSVDAVSKANAKDYAKLGTCSAEHIKACGVPECGLSLAPYPDAMCREGTCTVALHAAPEPPK